MGFREKRRTFVLAFPEDSDYAGLEVRAKSISFGQLMGVLNLARMGEGGKKFGVEDIQDIDEMIRIFAGRLVSWNLEDEDGDPVSLEPVHVETGDSIGTLQRETPAEARYRVLMERDMGMVLDLVLAWLDGMVGTPGPLDKNSHSGGPSEEVSIPMEPLSASLPN